MNPSVAAGAILSFLGEPVRGAAKVALSTTSSWIVAGAAQMLAEVIKLIGLVTTPSLTASWFSPTYWRIAGLALLLTVPFLFAAAVQAVVRTDLGVLLRAAFVDLPVAVLAVTITGPLIGLLLAATDQMCGAVTGGGAAGGAFLSRTSDLLPTIGVGFMPVTVAVVILFAGMVLLVELIMRAAAIYIVVLFLPLAFAAMVWPARRVWVKRMVELLLALILSKFAMVAILSLAVTGITSFMPTASSLSTAFIAMALMVLAACSPWALLRLLPFTEIAAGVGSTLHQEAHRSLEAPKQLLGAAAGLAGMAGDPDGLIRLVRGGASPDTDGRGVPALPAPGPGSGDATRGDGGAGPDGAGGGRLGDDGAGDGGAGSGGSGGAAPEPVVDTDGDSGAGPLTATATPVAASPPAEVTPPASASTPSGGDGSARGTVEMAHPEPDELTGAAAQEPEGPAAAHLAVEDESPVLHGDNPYVAVSLGRDRVVSAVEGDDSAGAADREPDER